MKKNIFLIIFIMCITLIIGCIQYTEKSNHRDEAQQIPSTKIPDVLNNSISSKSQTVPLADKGRNYTLGLNNSVTFSNGYGIRFNGLPFAECPSGLPNEVIAEVSGVEFTLLKKDGLPINDGLGNSLNVIICKGDSKLITELGNITITILNYKFTEYLPSGKPTMPGIVEFNTNNISEKGFLEGKIIISPLCPVETFPPNPSCQPTEETYKARPIAVWTADKKTKVAQIEPNLDGTYKMELSVGNYIVDLEKQQPVEVGGNNLPSTVTINSGETTIFNINIDTGIR